MWTYGEWRETWRGMRHRTDEQPPAMGVREPRRPKPQTGSGGAALQPPRDDYREAAALAESPRLVVARPGS